MKSTGFKVIVGLGPIAMISVGTYLVHGTGMALIVGGGTIWGSYLISLRTKQKSESTA